MSLPELELEDRGYGLRVVGSNGSNAVSIPFEKYWPADANEPMEVKGFQPLPRAVRDAIMWTPPAEIRDAERSVPPPGFEHLLPYQVEGVTRAVEAGGRIMIADEMGLGKTLQAVATAVYYRDDWPLLVVCPASVKVHWSREFAPHVGDTPIVIVEGAVRTWPKGPCIVIMSYEMMVRLKPAGFKSVILDESHMIKTLKSKRTQVALGLCNHGAKRVILLSGTPMNRPSDIYPQLRCVANWFTTFHHGPSFPRKDVFYFANRYCDPKLEFIRGKRIWNTSGSSKLSELGAICRRVTVRRLKSDVLTQLPEIERERVHICMSSVPAPEVPEGANPLNDKNFMECVRKTCETKIKPVCEYLEEVVVPTLDEQKIIVFGHHRIMLDAVEKVFKPEQVVRIDGDVPPDRRQVLVDRYQRDPRVRVAVLSIAATGVGLTLTAGSVAYFTELVFGPDQTAQAEARIHRMGQRRHVLVRYLVSGGNTTDMVVWGILQRKTAIATEVLDGKRKFINYKQVNLDDDSGDESGSESEAKRSKHT